MGTWIYLGVDFRNVSQDSWESVYEETLDLVRAYPFMDRIVDKTTYGKTFAYVDRARERYLAPWHPDKPGWYVIGDMETLEHAEGFMLFRDVNYWNRYQENQNTHGGTGEVYFTLIKNRIGIHPEIAATSPGAIGVFESKTQGYDYHTYLLAICCLIEDRLKPHAVTGGDITLGQIRDSVDWANRHLKKAVALPDRCDNQALAARIAPHLKSEEAQLQALSMLSLYPEGPELPDTIRRDYATFSDITKWRKGSALHPVVEHNIRSLRAFSEDLQDELHRDFAGTTREERIKILLMYNRFFFVCKETWDYLFERIGDDNLFCRTLALLQVHADNIQDSTMLKCIFCNLAFLRHFFLEDADS